MKSLFEFEVSDASDDAFDIEIPSAADAGLGAEVEARDMSDGSNPVTVTPEDGTIDGESDATVPEGGTLRLRSDVVKWSVKRMITVVVDPGA